MSRPLSCHPVMRGDIGDWYPSPFLDVQLDSYDQVIINSVVTIRRDIPTTDAPYPNPLVARFRSPGAILRPLISILRTIADSFLLSDRVKLRTHPEQRTATDTQDRKGAILF